MNQVGVSRQLARFAQGLTFDKLPRPVVEKAKELILDQLGVELAGSTLRWNQIIYDYVKNMGAPGKSTVVNFGLKTNPEYAAVANGTFGHGFEIDDYHIGALAHPSCVAIPACLGVGEELDIDGKQLIVSVAITSEVVIRLGLAMGQSMLMDRGFHETCVEGTLASALGISNMLKLSEEQTLNALSIAGSHSSGIIEYGQTGGDVKRLHAGLGAMGGIRSALVARLGFTGPPTILEGKRGILQAFANTYDITRLSDGLGQVYEFRDVCIKPYCCCGLIHPQIDAMAQICAEHKLKADDIEEIDLGADRLSLSHCGAIGPTPKDITGAQFSTHFSLGLTVAKGANDFKTYIEAMKTGFQDPRVLQVARTVKVSYDEECQKDFPQINMCKATIKTKDGRSFSAKVDYAKGTKGNPVTREELTDKFMGLATVVLPERKATQLCDMILNLEKLDKVTRITQLVTA